MAERMASREAQEAANTFLTIVRTSDPAERALELTRLRASLGEHRTQPRFWEDFQAALKAQGVRGADLAAVAEGVKAYAAFRSFLENKDETAGKEWTALMDKNGRQKYFLYAFSAALRPEEHALYHAYREKPVHGSSYAGFVQGVLEVSNGKNLGKYDNDFVRGLRGDGALAATPKPEKLSAAQMVEHFVKGEKLPLILAAVEHMKEGDRQKFYNSLYRAFRKSDTDFERFCRRASYDKNYAAHVQDFLTLASRDTHYADALRGAGVRMASTKIFDPATLRAWAVYTAMTAGGDALSKLVATIRSKEPRALTSFQPELSGRAADLQAYRTYLKAWLTTKVEPQTVEDAATRTRRHVEPAYELYDLFGLIDAVSAEVQTGTSVDARWLDGQLAQGEFKAFMDKRIPFDVQADIIDPLLSGNGVHSAVYALLPDGRTGKTAIGPGLDANDRLHATRIRALKTMFVRLADETAFRPIQGDLRGVDTHQPAFDAKTDGVAVKALQAFLDQQATDDNAFAQALGRIRLTRENIEQNGQFTENTAKALATFLSYKKGTWDREQSAFQQLGPAFRIAPDRTVR